MLSGAVSDPASQSRFAIRNASTLRLLARAPYRVLHRTLVAGAWFETWLRWPLSTLNQGDALSSMFDAVDPDRTRFGLSPATQRRYRNYQLMLDIPDLATLLLKLDDAQFRRSAMRVKGRDIVECERQHGRGAIVAGFRIGPYPVTPLALASLGYDVTMIVGGEPLADAGRELGQEFAPTLASRIRYINALDRRVLPAARADLAAGRVVATLLELSPYSFQKTTSVSFLGWQTQVAYGIPYLAATTGCSIVPLVMTRSSGPRYSMRFLDPIPPPAQDRLSIFEATQALWTALERQVLKYPDQWIGWTRLESHLGIDVTTPPVTSTP